MVSGRVVWKLILLFLASAFLIKPVFASTTDGTISSGYAWSARIGWINFAASNGNVHVTDAGLTGSAWSELYGWIKLDPSSSGVTNNGEGDLSGSAWGANIGWIDFSGVNIGSDGIFYGTASGTNTGIINFSCTHCLVQTDWRPGSVRSIPPPAAAIPVASAGASSGVVPETSTPSVAPASSSTDTFSTTSSSTFFPSKPSLILESSSSEQGSLSGSALTSTLKEKEVVESEKSILPIQKLESYFSSSSTVKNFLLENRAFRLVYVAVILVVVLLLRYVYKNKKDKP